MHASALSSQRTVLVIVSAFGIVVFAQITQVLGWQYAWLPIAIVGLPIALLFAAPKLYPRDAGQPTVDVSRAWWRVAPLLFNPWVFGTIATVLWALTPWQQLGSPPRPGEAVQSVQSLYNSVYGIGVLVTSLFALYLWIRSGVLAESRLLTAYGIVILLLTSIGGLLVYIVTS